MEYTSMEKKLNTWSPDVRIIKTHISCIYPLKRDDSIWWIHTDKEDFRSINSYGDIVMKNSFSTKWRKLIPFLDKSYWAVEELLKRIGDNASGEKVRKYLASLIGGGEIEVEEKLLKEGDTTQSGYILKKDVFQHRILSVETHKIFQDTHPLFETFHDFFIQTLEEDFPLAEAQHEKPTSTIKPTYTIDTALELLKDNE